MVAIDTLTAFESIRLDLAAQGFLLCDLKALASLPKSIWLATDAQSVEPKAFKSGSLLLVGHAGTEFWETFGKNQANSALQKSDPIDSYSADITQQVIEKYLPNVAKKRLFPAVDCPVNLMALGRAFGWHHPSPLGMGIHTEYGLWSAYRALWWVDVECEDQRTDNNIASKPDSPKQLSAICLACQTQECVSTCPASAIGYSQNPDLGRCADYRLMADSQCESTCLSRMACPYAAEHRYTESQMSYHYNLARSAIAKYRQQSQ